MIQMSSNLVHLQQHTLLLNPEECLRKQKGPIDRVDVQARSYMLAYMDRASMGGRVLLGCCFTFKKGCQSTPSPTSADQCGSFVMNK